MNSSSTPMPTSPAPRSFEELHDLCSTQPYEAIAWLRLLERQGVVSHHLDVSRHVIFIDAGSTARDPALITEGIHLLEAELAQVEAQGQSFEASL